MSELKWVLVAGTGSYELAPPVLWMSTAIGTLLARESFGLVVGGWSGVDYVTAAAFAAEIQRRGARLADALIQVVPSNSDLPRFRGGHVVTVPPGILEFTENVKFCNAAVLLGGLGGTYGVYQVARQEQKAVFPVPATGGDARQAYAELISDWPSALPAGVGEVEFRRLGREISAVPDAEAAAADVLDLIGITLTARNQGAPKRSVFVSYSHKDKMWLDRLREKLRPLEQRGELQLWADPEILPGAEWLQQIQAAVASSEVAILLVSPNSINSEFISQQELNWMMHNASSGKLKILWFVLSACDYARFGLSRIQAVHDPSTPLDQLSPSAQNEALVAICKTIRTVVRTLEYPSDGVRLPSPPPARA